MLDELTDILLEHGDTPAAALDHWARERPDAPFLIQEQAGRTLTYDDVRRRTDAIAGNVVAHGIAPGDRVSLFLHDPVDTTLWMYGLWKAGAVYAPINPTFTRRLLAYQLQDTRPVLVICDERTLPALEEVRGELGDAPPRIAVDGEAGRHGFRTVEYTDLVAPAAAPEVERRFDDPALIIYTSGTTGPSKGVLLPIRWTAQYAASMRSIVNEHDVVYNDLPMFHVGGSIANTVRAGWRGAGVSVWDRFSPSDFWRRVKATNATTAILLDVMVPWLLKVPPAEDDRENPLRHVHMQPLAVEHRAFTTRFGIDFATVGFGQTETGTLFFGFLEETTEEGGTPPAWRHGLSRAGMREAAARLGAPVVDGATVSGPTLMGLPTPFFDIAIVDDGDRPVPAGETGQLVQRPKLPGTVISEYINKPDKTVEAFKNLWFHTGDRGRLADDGLFHYVERIGDRIRVRGENLSAFQVEELLCDHPAVLMAAVFGVPSRDGTEDDVVAYVEPADGPVDLEALAAWCVEQLPKYLRPTYLRQVEELPRTPTNKLAKYQLKERFLAEAAAR
jgi:crotonobetaine/carnitine-CoA ligase